MSRRTNIAIRWSAFLIPALAMLTGCETPTVNLSTDEPIRVEIDVRLDVYQHREEGEQDTTSSETEPEAMDATRDRKNRLADIQTMKNNRLVGEDRNGLLVVLENPGGDYGDYVAKVVRQENQDRMAIMRQAAEEEGISLADVQARQAELNRTRAFEGEYIEVNLPDGGGWQWVQKEG